MQVEARHREALHSALVTGVEYALARGLREREDVADAAADGVRASMPDALGALRPAGQLLFKMAEANLQEWRPRLDAS